MGGIRKFVSRWKTEYDFKTFAAAFASLAATVVFALYNGFLGIYDASIWHGTICVYYIFLVFLRVLIVTAERKGVLQRKRGFTASKAYMLVSVYLLILNISLVVPFYLMVRQQSPVHMTRVTAILMATYTTYKVTMASINLRKRKQSGNSFVWLLRTIGFIDALVSIITLQNTLIMVNSDGEEAGLMTLTAISSGAIWIAILALSFMAVRKGFRDGTPEQ